MRITLNCLSGSLAGRTLEFDEPVITIGRENGNLVKFDPVQDSRISGNHCEIFEQDGKCYVRDKDSLNGTLVNGQRISEPMRLRNGVVLKLGEKGPEIKVSFASLDALAPTLVRTEGGKTAGTAGRAAPGGGGGKQGIGLMTLEGKLAEAKEEVRQEQHRKATHTRAAVAVVLLLAMGAAGLVWKFSRESTEKIERDVKSVKEQVKKVWDFAGALDVKLARNEGEMRGQIMSLGSRISTKERHVTELAGKLEQGSALSAEERSRIKTEFKSAKRELAAMQENLEAYQEENRSLFDKATAPFKQVARDYRRSVYAVFYRKGTSGKDEYKYTFIGTAFALNPTLGLLGTNGHISEPVKELMASGKGQVVVRCNGSPRHTYRVAKALTHPDYLMALKAKGVQHRSPDVGILQVDLTVGGETVALPSYLHPATPAELDAFVPGVPVGLLGFPGEYKQIYEGPGGSTNVAKLVPGIVSSTLTFAGAPMPGGQFQFLEHTCMSTPGTSGSPLFNTAGKVVAINNASEKAMVAMLDRATGKMGLGRLSVGPVRYGVSVRFLRHLVVLHYGEGNWD